MPRPTAEAQTALHNAADYSVHPYFDQRRHVESLLDLRCGIVLRDLHGLAPEPLMGARLLDIGCDTGAFVRALGERLGMEPWGIEVSTWAAAEAGAGGLRVHPGTVETAPMEFRDFRVVTAIDVIEHVADPEAFLISVRDRMEPTGVLYIQTPNPTSTVYGLGRMWFRLTGSKRSPTVDRLFPAEHVQYFSAAGLKTIADRTGFEIVMMRRRSLTAAELATSPVVRVGVMALQVVDRLSAREILHAAVLRRKAAS